MYTDKLIEGEEAFKAFMAKFRPGETVEWGETIGHCGEITVEFFYERSNREAQEDKPFRLFYWLHMPTYGYNERGFHDVSTRRHELHEKIRRGEI